MDFSHTLICDAFVEQLASSGTVTQLTPQKKKNTLLSCDCAKWEAIRTASLLSAATSVAGRSSASAAGWRVCCEGGEGG